MITRLNFVHDLLPIHCLISLCKHCSFSSRRHGSPFDVRILIPRKAIHCAGPSILLYVISTSNLVTHHSIARCSALPHCDVFGIPYSNKLSRQCIVYYTSFSCRMNCRASATAVKILEVKKRVLYPHGGDLSISYQQVFI